MKKRIVAVVLALPTLLTGAAFGEALTGKLSADEILASSEPEDWRRPDPNNLVYLDFKSGQVVIELSSRLAPQHVDRFRTLVRRGFYDGLTFYRVIDGFVAQAGDAFGRRESQDDMAPLAAEFETTLGDASDFAPLEAQDGYADHVGFVDDMPAAFDGERKEAWLLHCTGAVAFARANEKDTATTEFYITLQPHRYLDKNISVFGRVLYGMEHVQALRRVQPVGGEEQDLGEEIVSMRLEADIPASDRRPLFVLKAGVDTFDAYVEARRNRPEAFFYFRPDYVDICQLPLPVRATSSP